MNSKELSELIEDEVNEYGNSTKWKETAEKLTYMHRTLQQSFVSKFIIPFVKKCSENYENGSYDGRNESALRFMNIMYSALMENYPQLNGVDFNLPLI